MIVDSGRNAPTFDPHFKVFHELMSFRVLDILLVSSLYDAFIMEEDGSIAMRLISEYQGLNLSKAPRIYRVSSAQEALEEMDRREYDMVITMPYLGGMNAQELAGEIKKKKPGIPVILVAHSTQATFPANSGDSLIDNAFIWCCEPDFLMAIVKNVEDHRNVDADTQRAMVRVIIYVEDSPYYRSFFLPLIYHEVVKQTQAVLDESINERHRILRMRARPKILMATNYEEAMELYERYKPHLFGIISDARFPRQGMVNSNSGVEFLKYVRDEVHDLPMLLLSSEVQNRDKADHIPAAFIDKNSSTIKDEIHQFFLGQLGFGDFVFRMPDESVVDVASSLREFEEKIGEIPGESLRYHVARNHFSNWVMARSEVTLAKELHRDTVSDMAHVEEVRVSIIEKIRSLRQRRQKGVVAKFSIRGYDPQINDFVKIGKGSLGGKARGLAFMWALLQREREKGSSISQHNLVIPTTCVITSDGFENFIAENKLHKFQPRSDEHLADVFLDAPLPRWLRYELKGFLLKCDFPLSVRSSSLLEDSHFSPYAGLYSTYFLTNNHDNLDERLHQLEGAIKLVYASTWFEGPKAYSRTTHNGRGDDAMAIIIQKVVGDRYGDTWYPAISGVAQSHNYYPILNMEADEGIAHIAMGIGKTVVEGEKSLRFSPAHPKRLIQFSTVKDILANSQRQLYGLDMKRSDCLNRHNSNLVKKDVQDCQHELPVQLLASTYIPEEERIRDANVPGLKIMSFSSILKYNMFPLADMLTELLTLAKEGMGCEVEIEFAVDIKPDLKESVLHFLQLRPMVTGGETLDVRICDRELKTAFGYSSMALGHGRFQDIQDIIYVNPERFNAAATRDIAHEIGMVNRQFNDTLQKYLLVGPGRWGSADNWLGIPVQWSEISNVGVIIEICNQAIRAEPSQGSHFFQNITSLGIPYLTIYEPESRSQTERNRLVDDSVKSDFFDWSWLQEQKVHWQGEYVCHVRLERPLLIKCNGKTSESVLHCRPVSSDIYCEQEGDNSL